MAKRGAVAYRIHRECPHCGKKFSTNRANKIYCKQPCQWAAWNKLHPRTKVEG